KSDLVDLKKEPRVRFRSFGDSSLDFELLCWANRPHDRGKLMDELNTTIYNRLNELEIEIPFPQRDVYLKSECSSGLNVL
ncbi:MAG: mechanosensitive ion channel, partial [Deltaproteobacteria bacterium]|nr:mechanosensitive ion channel [Deltaproteobacteria bacterium]